MIHIEFTVSRRHLWVVAGLIALAILAWPSMSRAGHTFDDVPDDNIFHNDIDWLAANGVTKGCNPSEGNTMFCPDSAVTRQTMAAFLKRLATGGAVDAGALGGEDASVILDRLEALEGDVAGLEAENAALEALLAGVSRDGDVLLFEGMNLQVVNGDGLTESSNSLGNLIIGYNEDPDDPEVRTGSHFVIVGSDNEWTSHGGIVSGYGNSVNGAYAAVTGGTLNRADGEYSSVSGGDSNVVSAEGSSVSGGMGNLIYSDGSWGTISGGYLNIVTRLNGHISGGSGNRVDSHGGAILGGSATTMTAPWGIYPGP